jgi:hypothetical protein
MLPIQPMNDDHAAACDGLAGVIEERGISVLFSVCLIHFTFF